MAERPRGRVARLDRKLHRGLNMPSSPSQASSPRRRWGRKSTVALAALFLGVLLLWMFWDAPDPADDARDPGDAESDLYVGGDSGPPAID